jgi:hypothetical protein
MSYLKGLSSESAAPRRWWMIYVPEIDELTQARHISETEDMARSLIAVSTDTPIADVGVRVVKKRLNARTAPRTAFEHGRLRPVIAWGPSRSSGSPISR